LAWTIEYADTAKGQLRKLDKQTARRIVNFMAERCTAQEMVKKNLSFDSPRGVVGALSYWKEIAHIRTKHGLSAT